MKVKIKVDDPETRAVWETVKRAKAEVESWPAWKRGQQPRITEPIEYVTVKSHGRYPAGSKCVASRPRVDTLVLSFADGGTVLLGDHYYLAGIEPNLTWAELEDLRCLQELDDISLAV